MNKLITGTVLLLSLGVGLSVARAQPPQWRGGGGWGATGTYGRLFDPKTVQTLHGTVTVVEQVQSRGMSPGIHVQLRTSRETIWVHLGPSWFLENQDVVLKVGDRVRVRGSRVKWGGKPAVIAMTVTKGEMTIQLRDAAGVPYWAGWRRQVGPPPRAGTGS